MRKLLLSASFLALAAPAVAQQPLPPAMPQQAPQIRVAPPAGVGASEGTAAPMPAQPSGGFGTLPPTNGADTAQRMNLDGAPAYTKQLQDNAQATLDQMTKGVAAPAVPSAAPGAAPVRLDSAPITNQSDLEALQQGNRDIVSLEQQVKKAELAVKLWGIVYNNEHAKAAREEEKKAREAKEKADKEKADREAAAATAAAASALGPLGAGRPGAVLGAGPGISGGMPMSLPSVQPQVVEVNGRSARLLVPGSGEVPVQVGTRLASGDRVVSISSSGVVLSGPGGRQTLGFGAGMATAAPMAQPAPVAQPIRGMAPRI